MANNKLSVKKRFDELREVADFTPETYELARKLMQQSMMEISLNLSYFAARLYGVCDTVWTTAIDTLAVTIGFHGVPALLINPNYVLELTEFDEKGELVNGTKNLSFVLCHENMHISMHHLTRHNELVGELGTLCAELVVNWTVGNVFAVRGMTSLAGTTASSKVMPTTPKRDAAGNLVYAKDGSVVRETAGLDPWKYYEKYSKDLREQGLTPVGISELYSCDTKCYEELLRMSKPPAPKNPCVRMAGDGEEGEDGQDSGPGKPGSGKSKGSQSVDISLDPTALEDIVGATIADAIAKVRARPDSTSRLREEIMQLAGLTDETSEVWGDLGLGSLRGETARTKQVDMWQQWFRQQCASRFAESDALVWDTSIVWETRLGWVGDEEMHHVVIAIDTSGSMQQSIIDKLAEMVGVSELFTADWLAFDGQAWPFVPGDILSGGGGTNFRCIDEYVQSLDEEPDAVLVVTDGYAPHITPHDYSKWIWLITPGGDDWPATHSEPMSCHKMVI